MLSLPSARYLYEHFWRRSLLWDRHRPMHIPGKYRACGFCLSVCPCENESCFVIPTSFDGSSVIGVSGCRNSELPRLGSSPCILLVWSSCIFFASLAVRRT